ncbi:MAG TPA: PAS domain S-box protein [Burkholderiaceae bacterium]|nr:PAS domain S-box protein [Burkholderiaceae bacterium]
MTDPLAPARREEVLRRLFEVYPDAVLLVDDQARVALANHQASDLLGYAPEALIGLSIHELVPEAVRERHVQFHAAFMRVPRARPMGNQLELVARRGDGREVLVEIALVPLQPQGLPYVLAALRDIGAYPRVRQALERARHAECIAQMGRLAVNAKEAERVLREAPAAMVVALQAQSVELYVVDHDERHLRVAGSAGSGVVATVGTRVANDSGSAPGWLLAHGAPLVSDLPPLAEGCASALGMPVSDRGRNVGALVVRSAEHNRFGGDQMRFVESMASLLATLLQRAASEEALRHSQRLEAVGQLTGGIAHDFNNLLTVIQGNLQVLADLPGLEEDDAVQSMVGAAMRATRRGADLTAKLLAFSRRQVLQPKAVDPARMLPPLADLLRRTLDARISIAVDVAADCPLCLADPGQLESALLNIAINARDAMPDGGSLAFSARGCEVPPAGESLVWDGPGVALAVSDSGSGMSESVLARAFEPFFTTKEAGRGTGLGLATVYGFARQSNGAVTLSSRLGEGTTVTLYLPAPPHGDLEAVAPGVRGDSGRRLPRDLSVLLVEDEPEVMRVVQAFLTGWGCKVTACTQAESALAELALPSTRFDLLLTDVVLGPGLRGTELALRAQVLRPDMPALLMSGYAYTAGDAPSQPLLRKPFSREQLAEAILRAIGRAA